MLSDQMISSLEYVHSMNYIHRDVKPDNFVIGKGNNANQIYLIDFGLAKRYRNITTHEHCLFESQKDLAGTARYASVSALKGNEQSRRDDLEALGFVLVYLLKGRLPWMGLTAARNSERYRKICAIKEKTTFEELCDGLPNEFVQYFYMVRQLRFSEEPHYGVYRQLFRQLFQRLGFVYDYVYCWNESDQIQRSQAIAETEKIVSPPEIQAIDPQPKVQVESEKITETPSSPNLSFQDKLFSHGAQAEVRGDNTPRAPESGAWKQLATSSGVLMRSSRNTEDRIGNPEKKSTQAEKRKENSLTLDRSERWKSQAAVDSVAKNITRRNRNGNTVRLVKKRMGVKIPSWMKQGVGR
jgi:serine/threonine protein kinase